jgi:hypothetical protein
MNLLRLFTPKEPVAPKEPDVPEHIERQRKQGPPFYCGTAFCGHSTIQAAAECWQRHCARWEETEAQFQRFLDAGKTEEARAFQKGAEQILRPELNPVNWPINRSSEAMQAEYIERANAESKR